MFRVCDLEKDRASGKSEYDTSIITNEHYRYISGPTLQVRPVLCAKFVQNVAHIAGPFSCSCQVIFLKIASLNHQLVWFLWFLIYTEFASVIVLSIWWNKNRQIRE